MEAVAAPPNCIPQKDSVLDLTKMNHIQNNLALALLRKNHLQKDPTLDLP